jgi:hypothetical protein
VLQKINKHELEWERRDQKGWSQTGGTNMASKKNRGQRGLLRGESEQAVEVRDRQTLAEEEDSRGKEDRWQTP